MSDARPRELGDPVLGGVSSDARARVSLSSVAKNLISAAAELQRPARLTKISRSEISFSQTLRTKTSSGSERARMGSGRGWCQTILRRTLEQGRGGEPNSESERAEAGIK